MKMDIQTQIQFIKTEIDKCSIIEYQEIYNIIKKSDSNYSKNINGVFIDLQKLDNNVIVQIYDYITFCSKLNKNITEYESIKNEIIQNNFQVNQEDEIIENDEVIEENTEEPITPIIKNKVSSTMKFYILKKKLTKPVSFFNSQIKDVLEYDTPYKV
tara:strand:+ start:193 stop:663 length:471 start_codon:yes stop_codon:yes gene_type:complete